MKVLFFIPSLAAGGAERQCSLISSMLKQKFGYDCEIILTFKNRISKDNEKIIKPANIRIHSLPKGVLTRLCKLYKIFLEAKKHDKECVLFNFLPGPSLYGGIAGRLAGIRRIYGGVRAEKLYKLPYMMQLIAHFFFSTKTIFNSHRSCENFFNWSYSRQKSLVISNGIFFRGPRSIPNNPVPIVMTVGRFVPSKDYNTWLRVIRAVVDTGRKLRAIIIGYGELEAEVRYLISELKLNDVVEIIPGDKSIDVYKFEETSDIFLSTSTREGTCNTIMEAANSELPVVATDVGDNTYLVKDGVTGYVLPVRDVKGLANAVIDLLENPSRRIEFGKNGKRNLMQNYSVERIVLQYVDLIEKS